jgi:hypothetical protein
MAEVESIETLRASLHGRGFVTFYDVFDDGHWRLIIAKLSDTAGHHVGSQSTTWTIHEAGVSTTYQIHQPCPEVVFASGQIEFSVNCAVPRSPGAYVKVLPRVSSVLDEVLHYFYAADSQMKMEREYVE